VVAPGAGAGLFLQNQAAAALNQRAKKVAMLEAEGGKLFSYLWCNCSKESQEQIARHPLQAMTRENVLRWANADGEEVEATEPGAVPLMEE
jgi:hypothetical protein